MMNPYINPYYFQQPSYQTTPNYSQSIPQMQMQTINGRLIDNIDSVTANEVSMSGINVFPKNDLSEVYIKSWLPNGTIQTLKFISSDVIERRKTPNDNFIAETETSGSTTIVDDYKGICERLDSIESQLKEILGRKEYKNESTSVSKHDATKKPNDKE